MSTENQNQEQNEDTNQEQNVGFTFKESPTNPTDIFESSADVVIIKEEEEENKTPPSTTPPDIKNENKEEKTEQEESSESKEASEQQEKKEDVDDEVLDLNDEVAFKHIKETHGLEFETLEDFLKSKEVKKLDPEVEKYLEYKAKTGRGYADFLETQKDWAAESPDVLIKTVLKLENPTLTQDEIDFLFDRDFGYDEEIDDDADINSKKINQKIESKKALAFLEKQKADYLVDRGSNDDDVPEVYKEAKKLVDQLYDEHTENEQRSTALRDDFVSKSTTVLNDKFEGFKFTIDNQDFRVKKVL
jgi:hypothetical protein